MTTKLTRWMTAVASLALVASGCSSDDAAGDTTDEAAAVSTTTPSSSAPDTVATTSTTTSAAPTTTTTSSSDTDGLVVEVTEAAGTDFTNRAIQDLDALGYTETEFVLSGQARSYAGEDLGPDGMWDVEVDGEAPFTTRMVVRRPADDADFSGVVVVEWFNVSAGFDSDPDWGYLHVELIREGHAYVGVSAQRTGVEALIGRADGRYTELSHPGDEFSYDIFTQAGVAAGGPGDAVETDIWGGLEPTHVIGVGESQSAFRMTTYANAVHPRSPDVYDGLFIHSRGDNPAPLDADGDMTADASPALIRTDLTVPVFTFQTETDVSPRLGSAAARQPDTDRLRLWEVAGTAHADAYLLQRVYGLSDGPGIGASLNCDQPVNDGPQFEVISAALHHLVDWVVDDVEPLGSPSIETTDDDPAEVVRDDDGTAVGGIRTPAVDVPVAVLSGEGQTGGNFCGLFGTSIPFSADELAARYGTPAEYVALVTASAQEAADAGHLLDTEVDTIIAAAEMVDF